MIKSSISDNDEISGTVGFEVFVEETRTEDLPPDGYCLPVTTNANNSAHIETDLLVSAAEGREGGSRRERRSEALPPKSSFVARGRNACLIKKALYPSKSEKARRAAGGNQGSDSGVSTDKRKGRKRPHSANASEAPLESEQTSTRNARKRRRPISARSSEASQQTEQLLPENSQDDLTSYDYLVTHDPQVITKWKEFYDCNFASTLSKKYLSKNENPAKGKPACIPLTPCIPWHLISSYELRLMNRSCDWGTRPVPVLSFDLIQTFLAHVHNFTAVGLEAQATAYSYGDGVVQYLSLTPQINEISNVTTRNSDITELNSLQRFCTIDPTKNIELFKMRCWIHTHPLYKAFMSSEDIVQLYWLRKDELHDSESPSNGKSFGIVISPRQEGVKALCVHLTDEAFVRMKRYEEIADGDLKGYLKTRLREGLENTFYCQIPFQISSVPCTVADVRDSEEVVGQLSSFILQSFLLTTKRIK